MLVLARLKPFRGWISGGGAALLPSSRLMTSKVHKPCVIVAFKAIIYGLCVCGLVKSKVLEADQSCIASRQIPLIDCIKLHSRCWQSKKYKVGGMWLRGHSVKLDPVATFPYTNPCTNSCTKSCTKSCTNPCTNSCTNSCTNPCTNPNSCTTHQSVLTKTSFRNRLHSTASICVTFKPFLSFLGPFLVLNKAHFFPLLMHQF